MIIYSFLTVFVACFNVICLFKNGFYDGSELLLQSRPLKRNEIVWTKFFVVTLIAAFYAIITCVIISFLLLVPGHDKNDVQAIIIGNLLGTFVNYMFWSGVAALFCSSFKNITTFIFTLTVCGILQIITILFNLQNMLDQKTNKSKEVFTDQLIQIYDQKDLNIDRQPYVIALDNKKKIINKNYQLNEVNITTLYPDLSLLLKQQSEQKYNLANKKVKAYFDINLSLLSTYYFFDNNIDSKKINNADRDDFKNNNFYFDFLEVDHKKFLENKLSFLNTIYFTNFTNYWADVRFADIYPIIELPFYDITNKTIKTVPIKNPVEFYQHFYAKEQVDLAYKLKQWLTVNKQVNDNPNFITYYFWVSSSWLLKELNLNLTNYRSNYQFVHKNDWYNNWYQYWTIMIMKDYFEVPNNKSLNDHILYINKNYPNVDKQMIETWLYLFEQNKTIQIVEHNQTINNVNYSYFTLNNLENVQIGTGDINFLVLQPNSFIQFLDELQNDTADIKKYDNLITWWQSQVRFIHVNDLATLSLLKISSIYNFWIIFTIYVSLASFMLYCSGWIIYKKDIN